MAKAIKVMVVEDEELLLQVITRKLIQLGFEVVACKTGKQGLDYLKNMTSPPDIIWLDYYLEEEMNGLDFMRELRKQPSLSKIPVVVVSNSASEEKKDALIALGAKRYILKAEHRLDEIIENVKNIASEESN